jgi:hypothetical protein
MTERQRPVLTIECRPSALAERAIGIGVRCPRAKTPPQQPRQLRATTPVLQRGIHAASRLCERVRVDSRVRDRGRPLARGQEIRPVDHSAAGPSYSRERASARARIAASE